MIVETFLERLHVQSHWAKLIVGAGLTTLTISLGMVVILRLLNFSINPGIPGALAAAGAAVYAARTRR